VASRLSSNISIILVEPQLGENIGAAARAMKNFGFSDLRIVNPRDGWPNEKARSMSVGAIDVIEGAQIFTNLNDAIADLGLVYATTSMTRSINKEQIYLDKITDEFLTGSRIGILFGRESSGLSNNEITRANKVISIRTEKEQASMNIAHAVAVVCYQLSCKRNVTPQHDFGKVVSHSQLEYFFEDLFDKLDKNGFFRVPQKKKQMSMKIRNIFTRIDGLTQVEAQTLMGIVKVLSDKDKDC
jgi:tRNA/rRNA methyltransferase